VLFIALNYTEWRLKMPDARKAILLKMIHPVYEKVKEMAESEGMTVTGFINSVLLKKTKDGE